MDKIVNILNLTGWAFLLVDLEIQLIFNLQDFLLQELSFPLLILRVVQLFQIFDILLVLLGKSKGSIVASFFQILGRGVVCFVFMEPDSDRLKFAAVAILWSIADVNRYLYYLFKDNAITSFLRYNSFIVLYPVGVFCEMLVINDYVDRNSWLTDTHLAIIRSMQVVIVVGLLFLYNYMLNSRKKHNISKKMEAEERKLRAQTTKKE